MDEGHAIGNHEGDKKGKSTSGYAQGQGEDTLQLGYNIDLLRPKRERGHRGIIGVTGTSIERISTLSGTPIGDRRAATPINDNKNITDGQTVDQQADG